MYGFCVICIVSSIILLFVILFVNLCWFWNIHYYYYYYVAKYACYKVQVLQVHVLQSEHVVKCTCCKVHKIRCQAIEIISYTFHFTHCIIPLLVLDIIEFCGLDGWSRLKVSSPKWVFPKIKYFGELCLIHELFEF